LDPFHAKPAQLRHMFVDESEVAAFLEGLLVRGAARS
jgi:hypothetical protein